MNLTGKKCVPCEGGVQPLDDAGEDRLLTSLEGWDILRDGEHRIEKNYTCKDFVGAIQFVNAIADVAESEGHHPNIYLHSWNQVRIIINTHSIGGLHENDFILAAKIDSLKRPAA